MNSTQRGITLIETLGALAIGTLMVIGLTAMIDRSMEETKGQQAAMYQSQVTEAARRYIATNSTDIKNGTPTPASVHAISIADLKKGDFLPASFSEKNAYNQDTCLLVRQPTSDKFEALVVGFGGEPIPEREIPAVAAAAGKGGGYISEASHMVAQGPSWRMNTAAYISQCKVGTVPVVRNVLTGATSDAGHLVSSIFQDAQTTGDFLYRNEVSNRPDLNRMSAPIHMAPGTAAQATEGETDDRCKDASHNGKIAVDAFGRILSCQGGVWKGYANGFWKDPVDKFELLPDTGNSIGDVRLAKDKGRAFSWNGLKWVGLAVNENGDLIVDNKLTANYVSLNKVEVKNEACAPDGLLARDGTGMLLTCRSGSWRSMLETRLTTRAFEQNYSLTPADGPKRDFVISLAAMPGPRPLYLTGYAHCRSMTSVRTFSGVEVRDAADEVLSYAGGCAVNSYGSSGGLQTKGYISLQKIPENATHLRVLMEPGADAQDHSLLTIVVFNSE
ncbi:shufflon system plasmid conjugative transfer pilus tip adhesin PilV [Noviherbaspirillum cavernae]|nr:shufflon system plasmid conjugative transfer pilus tip adhesin PilV [Noviherbaspirillum cavernae]